ncbi:MarC family transcriptional regulator [Maritimibacter sp. 55A14]|uniref:MarC family protein n=1 Tax=Maritimibacter sp. 55A14 TaxID=2174844 RepID=UPI000D606A87|nr:MarC family protein [Maritimibacter sp. 55A14]PWE34160.1 MarC family transcriptional regulator [Maritimibacter sp. 55A14]
MDPSVAITAFVALFVIIDPIGLTPVFVALTRGASGRARRGIAIRACLTGVALLTVFGLAGEAVLNFVGISMPAFRISGGILLFITALDMLFERRSQRREGQTAEHDDPSVFPLAMPLIAGPGAMATMILLAGQSGGDPLHLLMVHLVMLGVVGLAFILFLAAAPLERALGHTGTLVISRLLGMLLAALSVQFVLDGLRDFGVI